MAFASSVRYRQDSGFIIQGSGAPDLGTREESYGGSRACLARAEKIVTYSTLRRFLCKGRL